MLLTIVGKCFLEYSNFTLLQISCTAILKLLQHWRLSYSNIPAAERTWPSLHAFSYCTNHRAIGSNECLGPNYCIPYWLHISSLLSFATHFPSPYWHSHASKMLIRKHHLHGSDKCNAFHKVIHRKAVFWNSPNTTFLSWMYLTVSGRRHDQFSALYANEYITVVSKPFYSASNKTSKQDSSPYTFAPAQNSQNPF